MFTCLVAFLLLNTFHWSFGYPLETNETLGKSLQLLADNCHNNFLSTQIKNHIEACDITLSAEREIKETELECLIFYDINSQLCTELQGSKLDPKETYDSKINQAQEVDKTCAEASKNWKFTNLTVYPTYYNTSQTVFKTLVRCLKACGVVDLFSEDTNFFCKYYQWGSELLQHLIPGVNGDTENTVTQPKTVPAVPNSSTSRNSANVSSVIEHSKPENAPAQAQEHMEGSKPPAQTKLDITGNEQIPLNGAQLNNNAHVKDSKAAVNSESHLSIVSTHTPSSVKNNTGHSVVSNNFPSLDRPAVSLNPKPEKEDQNIDAVDDNDEGVYDSADTLEEAQLARSPINDDSDPNLESEVKVKEKTKNQHKNVESIVSSLDNPGSQKDIYSNTMSDQFGEVDDHFFSFFLTASILVIFFYVLYHNKSKFRKVFLGLLVEGRQPGRRRNSRGHEYRRLDTLEQAMSTNSAAPPSKIIY